MKQIQAISNTKTVGTVWESLEQPQKKYFCCFVFFVQVQGYGNLELEPHPNKSIPHALVRFSPWFSHARWC